MAISCCCCCCSFSSSATRLLRSCVSASRAARVSFVWVSSCCSIAPSPPALMPDCVPALVASLAPGGTISNRASATRGALVAEACAGFETGVAVALAADTSASAGCGAARRDARHSWIWAWTMALACCASSSVIATPAGARNTVPALRRLMLPPMNASGFARNSAIMVWSSEPGPATCAAMADSVSPLRTW